MQDVEMAPPPGAESELYCDAPENSRTFGYSFLMWALMTFMLCLLLENLGEVPTLPYLERQRIHLAPVIDTQFFVERKMVQNLKILIRTAKQFHSEWTATFRSHDKIVRKASGVVEDSHTLFSMSGVPCNIIDIRVDKAPQDITIIAIQDFDIVGFLLFIMNCNLSVVIVALTISVVKGKRRVEQLLAFLVLLGPCLLAVLRSTASALYYIQLTGIVDVVRVIRFLHEVLVALVRISNCIMRCHMLAIVHAMLPGNRAFMWICDAALLAGMITQSFRSIPGYPTTLDEAIGSVYALYLVGSVLLAFWTVEPCSRHVLITKAEVIMVVTVIMATLEMASNDVSAFDSKWLFSALYAVGMTIYHSPKYVLRYYSRMTEDDVRHGPSLGVDHT